MLDFLNNLRLRSRILLVFGALCVAVAFCGFVAIDRLNLSQAISVEIRNHHFRAMEMTTRMAALAERYQLLLAQHILSPAPQEMAAIESAAASLVENYKTLRASYLTHKHSPAEAALFETMSNRWDQMLSAGDGLWPLSRRGADHAAWVALRDNITVNLAPLRQAMQEMSTLQEEELQAEIARWQDARGTALSSVIAIIALTLAATVLGTLLLLYTVSRPVGEITRQMGRMAEGALDAPPPFMDRRDEVGEIARALDVLRRGNQTARDLMTERTARMARLESLLKDFDGSMGDTMKTVASAATELESTAGEMSDAAGTGSRRATATAAAAIDMADNIGTVASAVEEINQSLAEVTRQVTLATGIVDRAVAQARSTDEIVTSLSAAASRIGDIVRLIGDVAEQTNLLALNATIEAARAGDAGKGFAVVATEVKTLAGQTAEAAADIGRQIEAIQAASSGAVGAIRGILETISQVNEATTTIAAAVTEQSAATQNIADTIGQVTSGSRQVAENIGEVNETAARAGSASAQVLSAARELSRESETLRHRVDQFFQLIRAA